MTSTAEKKLEDILLQGNDIALRRFFEDTTDEQRRAMAKTAIAAYKTATAGRNSQSIRCAINAVLLTASASQIEKIALWSVRRGDLDFELLERYKPPTVQKWVDRLLEQHRIDLDVIDELVSRGIIEQPDTDDYVTHMMGSMRLAGFRESPIAILKRDKKFIDHFVWRLFEVEGDGENSLAANDKYSRADATWEYALVELSREGAISRERLLDASLEALDRGFLQFRSGWYSRFHEALQPTIAERQARAIAYAKLLGSSIPPTVSFALNALKEVAKEQPLPADLLVEYMTPALDSKSKASVTSALSFIEIAIKSDADSTVALCALAARGLLHESPEIQNKVVALITKYASDHNDELKAELRQYEEFLAPSVKKKLGSLVDGTKSTVEAAKAGASSTKAEPYKASSEPLPYPLDTARRLEEFKSVDELIAGCSYCLEHPYEPMEIERAIAGIVHFCSRLPDDFAARSEPLKKRALQIKEKNLDSVTLLQSWFAGFVHCWLTGDQKLPYRVFYDAPAQRFMHNRLCRLLERSIQRNSLPVLSSPTHERGWIEPSVLASRLREFASAGQVPDVYDQATALLRLPMAQLDHLLPDYLSFPGEFWDAVRYSNKRSDNIRDDSTVLWQAAAAYREPQQTAKLCNIGEGAIYKLQSDLDFIRLLGTCFPSLRNQFVASGIRQIGHAIDWFDAMSRCVRAYIEVLLDPSFVFDQPAYHVLAAGIILPDPESAGVARDVVIQLVDSNRLSVEDLGTEVGTFLYCGKSKTKRLVQSMSDIARLGPKHTSAVRQVLERALQGGEIVPRDLSVVLELLNELLHSEGRKLENPATIKHLQSAAKSGKAAKLVKEMVPK